MAVTLHILKESGRLNLFENLIKKAFNDSLTKVEHLIQLPDIDIVVADNPGSTIPEVGVGGTTENSNLMYVSIDPEFRDLKKILVEELQSTFAHEMHHCARMATIGYGKTLLQAMVSEGLADHFDIQVNGVKPRPWSVAIAGKELEEVKEMAEKEYNKHDYNHSEWFFGSREKNIPRWAGYAIGFDIVGEYIKKNGKTAAELTIQNPENFVS